MRKIIFALFLLTASLTLHNTLQAQVAVASKGGSGGGHGGGNDGGNNSIPASQVPKPVRANFKSMYPGATHVQWEYKPVYYGAPVYTASFNLNGQKWEANYYADGTFISAYPKA